MVAPDRPPALLSLRVIGVVPKAGLAACLTRFEKRGAAMAKLNNDWHARNRMPANASLAQRIAWHRAHVRACGCRSMPAKIAEAIAAGKALAKTRRRRP